MKKLLMAAVLSLAATVPAFSEPPDLSGTWYSIDPNMPDDGPAQCIPSSDMAHLVAINNGTNPVHIFTDKNGRAVRVEFGNGPLATGYTRSEASCVADYKAKESEFMQDMSTVTVQQDDGN